VIGIVTDSNSQLPAELARRYDVEVVPLSVTVDGVEHLEGVDLDADAFYRMFETGSPTVSTAQPSPGRFQAAYEAVAARGADQILSIHIGSSLSGTVNSARLAAQLSPVPVRVVDTGTASFAVACCTWEAAEAVAAGATVEEAAAMAQRVASTVGSVWVVRALDLVRAGGRLVGDDASTSAIPVLTLVPDGIRVVGEVGDLAEAADTMAAHVRQGGSALRVGVGVANGGAAPLWQALEDRLRAAPEVRELVRYRIGPSVGAHTGPGTAGAMYYPSPFPANR
jgi:DegV family protein with EDD domain